ncbi:unnamed protein product [Caenorhabditis brenneri]
MDMLPRICNARNLQHPFFRIFKGTHDWDKQKVHSSEAIKQLKAGQIEREDTVKFFKNEFCCDEPNCLKRCGIYLKKDKIPLVENFPQDVNEIF